MASTTNQPNQPAPATPTTVTITQTNHTQITVDLHDLSLENADKLYAALGRTGTNTDYQDLARQVAGFAHNFKSIVSIGLPAGMGYQAAMNNFMKALKANGGTITEGSDQYLKDLQNSALGQSIIQTGMYRTAAGVAAGVDAVGEFVNGTVAPLRVVGALTSAATGTAADLYDQIGFGMSDRQAQAIGTAYAAALYSKVDAPGIQHQPTIIEKGIAYVESVASNIWQLLPASLTAYLGAAVKFMANGYHWDAAYNEAFAEATAARRAPALTYEQTLQRNMVASADRSARPEAAEMLRQAGTIAGTATAPIADMVEHGGVYRDTDGTFNTLTFDHGKPVTARLNNTDGQPMTMSQRTHDRMQAVREALPDSTAGWVGAFVGGSGIAAVETRLAPLRRVLNLVPQFLGGTVKFATNMTLGTISVVDRAASGVVGAVLPSSAGIRANEIEDATAINRAGDTAAERAAKLGKKNGLTGEALENAMKEAAEAARAKAEAALKPRGLFSRAFDFLRPAGDAFHDTGVQVAENKASLRKWINGGIDRVVQAFTFDHRTADRKVADAARAEADRAVQIALGNARTAAPVAVSPTAPEPVVPHPAEPIAPSVAVRTEPVVPHPAAAAGAAETARGVAGVTESATHATTIAETARTIAEGSRAVAQRAEGKGPWGKLVILGAALFGAGAAGVAEAAEPTKPGENKIVNVAAAAARGGLWDTLGGMVGLPDFAHGDITRGAGALASWIPLVPGTAIVDTFRQVDAVDKVPAAQVAQLDGLFNTIPSTKKTGNVYLDRVLALKAMQARGVKEVAMAPMNNFNPIWSTDNMGEVAHEGASFTMYNPDGPQEITASVQEAIDMNLRLFVVKGGNLETAQAAIATLAPVMVKPAAPAPAPVEPASAPVAQAAPTPATTATLTNAQLLAGHKDVIQQARMSVNRVASDATRPTALNLGSSFASVDSTRAAIATRTPGTGGGQQAEQHAMIA